MRRIFLIALFFVSCLVLYRYAYCEDNLLALDAGYDKKKGIPADSSSQKDGSGDKVIKPEEQMLPDDSDKELEKMRAYRYLIQGKQKELDLIKLDLEKSSLLLKEKETQKAIYQIGKTTPQTAKKEDEDEKEPSLDSSEIKLRLLVIADNLKEGQIVLKGTPCGFKEGDVIASRLRAEKIEPQGVTLREPDGTVLKLNFVD